MSDNFNPRLMAIHAAAVRIIAAMMIVGMIAFRLPQRVSVLLPSPGLGLFSKVCSRSTPKHLFDFSYYLSFVFSSVFYFLLLSRFPLIGECGSHMKFSFSPSLLAPQLRSGALSQNCYPCELSPKRDSYGFNMLSCPLLPTRDGFTFSQSAV